MKPWVLMISLAAGLVWSGLAADEPAAAPPPARLANGVPVEGVVQKAGPEGLTVQTSKETVIIPWKHLSAGTRFRLERAARAQPATGKAPAAAPAAKPPATNAPPGAPAKK